MAGTIFKAHGQDLYERFLVSPLVGESLKRWRLLEVGLVISGDTCKGGPIGDRPHRWVVIPCVARLGQCLRQNLRGLLLSWVLAEFARPAFDGWVSLEACKTCPYRLVLPRGRETYLMRLGLASNQRDLLEVSSDLDQRLILSRSGMIPFLRLRRVLSVFEGRVFTLNINPQLYRRFSLL